MMKILMLGNSFTSTHHLPELLAELTGAEVTAHTRGGARLAEHLNPSTKMGKRTQDALEQTKWDYVILQEMSNGPITSKEKFMKSVCLLCEKIREHQAVPVLYGTWAYQKDGKKLKSFGMDYDEMYLKMHDSYKEAAEENSVLLADVGTAFYKCSREKNLYAEDGCHPNEEGALLAAKILAEMIMMK